ncbi:MAG TPA: hypothetical protein PLB91_12125 [Spirochaetales bacterium]|nr:hypothetical protein [Spirochaetales bacterium]HRY54576.1 hypothetical protein [Spirochaetia bacterium]HRZ64584.1 hypothetical protein [Spirochaetia bacterium]
MRDRGPLANTMKRGLHESLNTDMLERIAREVFAEEYDLHERTGFPPSVAVPGQVAVDCIVDDAVAQGRFLHLAERLVRLDNEGFMGRAYRVTGLREVFKGIAAEGYLWDEETGHFMEDPHIRRTPSWGRLIPGEEHRFSLLRVDVVRNSQLVRTYGEAAARDAFDDLRSILARCVELRSGRIWSWEGDGALAAFLFGHSTTSAVLSGMALLHELFLYDRIYNSLGEPLKVRAAVHTGPIRYFPEVGEIAKQETVLEVMEAESRWTPPGMLSITPAVAPTLDRVILDRFRPDQAESSRLLVYEVRLGSP